MSKRRTEARLAALCAAAGYPGEVRELIAHATFPKHEYGTPLSERELVQLAEAVKVLAEAGRTGELLPELVAHYEARFGERWREVFWERALRTAAFRAAHPELRRRKPANGRERDSPGGAAAHRVLGLARAGSSGTAGDSSARGGHA
jgi:hypothetical protein